MKKKMERKMKGIEKMTGVWLVHRWGGEKGLGSKVENGEKMSGKKLKNGGKRKNK